MYFIGNCYCWATILKIVYGGELNKRPCGHYILIDEDKNIRHFKRVFSLLPGPLKNLIFIGKFENRISKVKKNVRSDVELSA